MSTPTSPQTDPSILLIDGHSMAYRAYHALPPEKFSTATGQTTNAVFGFVSMLLTALDAEAPTHIVVAFDRGRPQFRLDQHPGYKAGRAKTPPDFHGQVELIEDVLAALRIPVVGLEAVEADDVLATLARLAEEAGVEARIASGDKDAFQLVRPGVTVLYPRKGMTDLVRMTPEAVEEKYGVTPAQYRGHAALVGEKADNLPGVPGVGPKTAAKWLTTYGDLDGILENADDIKGKAGENLRAHVDDVARNYRLNRLLDDVELPLGIADAVRREPDREALGTLFDQLEFAVLGRRVEAVLGAGEGTDVAAAEVPEPVRVDSGSLRHELDAVRATDWVAVATDAAYVLGQGTVDHLALAAGDRVSLIDLTDLDAPATDALSAFLTDHPRLVAHDAKPQLKALWDAGFTGAHADWDTQLAGYLIEPDKRSHDLGDLASTHLGGALPDAPDDAPAADVAARAWAIAQLRPVLAEQLDAHGATGIMEQIEVPVLDILARMETRGIAVDRDRLDALGGEFREQADASAQAAYAAIGHEVNLGSPKQLQEVLFDELDMPKTKKTKTGYTTDAAALADLFARTEHPFLQHLLAHRDRTKLSQTVVGLEKTLADDGRIHTTYLQTVAATGRLSSKDPNLQNIPVRTEAGRRIREVFVPGAGADALLTADYSQIEMRIMAHLSGDPSLISAFLAGEDLHAFVGAQVFGVQTADVTPEMRAKVKAMSYGLVYGLSAYGLAQQLAIGVDEARGLMDGYFARFGAVRDYLSTVVEEARSRGYTETMDGRRRYLPALQSDRRQMREMAERAALNAPIQGSAADIMKTAMIRVDGAMREADLGSRALLQVHDEIIVELMPDEHEAVTDIVRREMAGAASLTVPLDVNVGIGSSWQDAAH
ncbi:DNA polymerase I [Brevibacterium yomogidense]|uniref:DNA polymerase I n=1 Tax=Brevibacterium yomogidense TaxID=946573 RepID=A0A1X6XII2_9MICO|nr:DNA polymerase I [Brevibacterium yomogidense]SLM98337.1 DNA polymerase I [Brevibacterium yomogidense]